jgi:hypothetical protein
VRSDLETTASVLRQSGVDVKVGILDISVAPIVEGRFPRLNPPAFKLFTNAVPLDYQQKYNHVDIVKWIARKIDVTEKVALTSADLMKAVTEYQTLIVYVGPLNIVKYRNFLTIKKEFHKYDDIGFVALDLIANDEFDFSLLLMPSLEEHGFGIRVYKQKNSKYYTDFGLNDQYTVDNIRHFVKLNSFYGYFMGQVTELSNESVLRVFDFGLPVVLYFRDVTSSERQYYDGEVQKAFETRGDKILFV